MRIAGYIQDSISDGPGLRLVLFLQGCPHRCPGCHNPHTHDINGGSIISPADVLELMSNNPLCDGLTLSGGEPFLQPSECAELARATHILGLNVWCYSGFTYEELLSFAASDHNTRELLDSIDVLVDGRFILAEKSLDSKWRGSRNQRIINMNKSKDAGSIVLFS